MPDVRLDPADAAELADMVRFLSDWLAADHGRLAASLRAFTGNSGYDLSQLRRDVDRFAILLGGSVGEPLFRHERRIPGQPRIRRAWRASTSFVLALRAAGAPR